MDDTHRDEDTEHVAFTMQRQNLHGMALWATGDESGQSYFAGRLAASITGRGVHRLVSNGYGAINASISRDIGVHVAVLSGVILLTVRICRLGRWNNCLSGS